MDLRLHDHIEILEDMVVDDYSHCKLFSFSLAGEDMIWLDQLPDGSLTCWKILGALKRLGALSLRTSSMRKILGSEKQDFNILARCP